MRHICEAVIAVYAQLGACSSYIWTACPCSKNLLRARFIAVVIGKKDSCSQAPAQLSVAGNTYQCHKVLGPPLDWAPSPGPNLLVKWDPHHEIGPPPLPLLVLALRSIGTCQCQYLCFTEGAKKEI